GSKLSQQGLDRYQTLVSREAHVAGALAMMAQWSLDDLLANLGSISNEVLFLLAENDATVPAKVGRASAAKLPHAEVVEIAGYGHLVHEENPDLVLDHIAQFLT
ncbi:MAG: alpha/beta fold hydrolase, partial [Pseudomonadota bacterium]